MLGDSLITVSILHCHRLADQLPVEMIHLLKCIRHGYNSILESTLDGKGLAGLASLYGVEWLGLLRPLTVVSPSSKAPKFDMRGLNDTIWLRISVLLR